MNLPARLAGAALLLAAGQTAAQESPAQPTAAEPAAEVPAKASAEAAEPAKSADPRPTAARTTTVRTGPARTTTTPLNERVAVIGALDKRLGTTAEFTLKPGQTFRFGRLSGLLRSCETTQPFERKQTAAFLQVSESPGAVGSAKPAAPKLVFSGWLFAESPSLNPFGHPVYDVWVKSCTMRFPDGPKAPNSSTGSRKSGPAKPATPRPAPAPEAAAPSQD